MAAKTATRSDLAGKSANRGQRRQEGSRASLPPCRKKAAGQRGVVTSCFNNAVHLMAFSYIMWALEETKLVLSHILF